MITMLFVCKQCLHDKILFKLKIMPIINEHSYFYKTFTIIDKK